MCRYLSALLSIILIFVTYSTRELVADDLCLRATIGNFIDPSAASEDVRGRNISVQEEQIEEVSPWQERQIAKELQLEFLKLNSELERLHEDHKTSADDTAMRAVLQRRTRAFVDRLAEVDSLVLVRLEQNMPYTFYRSRLERFKKERRQIYRDIEKAHRAGDTKTLQQRNVAAIDVNRELLKLRLKVAGMLIAGEYRLKEPAFMRNAAKWTLRGAIFNAKELADELLFRTRRLEGAKKRKAFEGPDAIGKMVSEVLIGGYGVKIIKPLPGEEPEITLTRGQWINVNAQLDEIAAELKRGQIERARRKITVLERYYNDRSRTLQTQHYKQIYEVLRDINNVLGDYPAIAVLDEEAFALIQRAIVALKRTVRNPKIYVRVESKPRKLSKELSANIKTIARYEPEYFLIMYVRTTMEYYMDNLEFARAFGFLSKEKKGHIIEELRSRAAWTERGLVHPKQFSYPLLKDAADYLSYDNFSAAHEKIGAVVNQMNVRLQEIDAITAKLRIDAEKQLTRYREREALYTSPFRAA